MKCNKVYVRIAEDDNFGTASIEQRPFTEAYIRKDALLEWIEKLKAQSWELREEGCGDVFYGAQIALLEEVINKIESL